MNCYTEHFVISSHDIDINGNVRPSIVCRLMQETANHHMRDRKPTYNELFEKGQSYIAIRMAIEQPAQLHMYEEVSVDTWTCSGKGATFLRCYRIRRGDEVVAKAYSEWAVVNLHTGKLCRKSEVDISNFEVDEPLEMHIPVRFHFPEDAAFEKVGEHHVTYSQCDRNLHMNNTFYQDMIWDYLPEMQEKKMTSFSLRFMAEAPLDGTVEIYRAPIETPFDDDCGAEESWYFKTIVNGRTNIEAIVGAARV